MLDHQHQRHKLDIIAIGASAAMSKPFADY